MTHRAPIQSRIRFHRFGRTRILNRPQSAVRVGCVGYRVRQRTPAVGVHTVGRRMRKVLFWLAAVAAFFVLGYAIVDFIVHLDAVN